MRRALVVGGGWAGASAAWELSKRGFQVTLIEKGKRLGGRAGSRYVEKFGREIDCGQHLMLGAYAETKRFLNEIGVEGRIRWGKSLSIDYYSPGGIQAFRAWSLPGPLSLLGALLGFEYLSGAEKRSALAFGWKSWSGLRNPQRLESLTALEWLMRCGQSESLCRKFWQPLSLAALNARLEEVQASLLAVTLSQGFLRGGSLAALGLPEQALSEYLEPGLERALQGREGKILRGRGSKGFQRQKDLWSLSLEDGELLEAEALVLALPASLAAKQGDLDLGGASDLEGSPIVTVHILSEVPILPSPWGLLSPTEDDQGFEFHWAFDRTQLFQERGPRGEQWSLFLASAARRLSGMGQDDILRELKRQLVRRFPGFDPASIRDSLVLKEGRATPKFVPKAARPPQKTKLSGLALAGDWTDTGLPATIEGAVLSGRLAAEALD